MSQTQETTTVKPIIAYMMNPDRVFYMKMDLEIVNYLRQAGAEVIEIEMKDIHFLINNTKDASETLYVKDKPLKVNGFLSYCYMSKFHFEAYTHIINTFHCMGVPTLHLPEVEIVLNNKYYQLLRFKKAGVPIPSSNMGFSVDSYKEITNQFYGGFSVSKKLSDYGGDGVVINKNNALAMNNCSKLLWKGSGEYTLFQSMIKDSPGKSVRVLCIENKPVACAMYHDKTGNYKSNNSFGYEFFSLDSLMDSPKLQQYFDLGVKACNSIGDNITIAGVDILDSNENGMVVLEVNLWPDIYDIAASTNIEIFPMFVEAYLRKVRRSIVDSKDWNVNCLIK